MTFPPSFQYVLLIIALLGISGPLHAQMNPAPAHPELRPVLAQFGGEAGLERLVDDFLDLLHADPRIAEFFVETDPIDFKNSLVDQFCVILGGDCSYEGLDMVAAHAELEISHADFNALVENLQLAMTRNGVPFRAQNKLLAKLAPMHREIVSD